MADEPGPDESGASATGARPSEVMSSRGQRLVPTNKRKRRIVQPSSEKKSLDDVLAPHQKVETDPEKPPPLPEVFSPADDIPPAEPDPARRDRPTMSRIVLTADAFEEGAELPPETEEVSRAREPVPDLSDGKLRSLEDINARFDLDGSGQYFIQVDRVQPRTVNAIVTCGRMRDITRTLSYKQFCEIYGGGQYRLTVYGPPARSRLIDPLTGRVKPKALTMPITFSVPWQGEGAREPNPLAALDESELDDRMPGLGHGGGDLESALLRRRTNNMADAKMLETSVQRDLQMDERQRLDRREERAERRAEENAAVRAVKETSGEAMQLLKDQLDLANQKIAELSSRGSNGSEVVTAVAEMAKSFGRSGASDMEMTRMRESYETQLENERRMHADRLKDIEARHKIELDEKERFFQRDKDDSVRRADESARAANERMRASEERLISERNQERSAAEKDRTQARETFERDKEVLKRDYERDMARQKEHYENLLRMEKETNARDRQTLESLHSTKGELQKTVVESENRQLNAEVKRLTSENNRLRDENEKKGNVSRVLKEARETAEAIGYAPDDGGKDEPQTWQQTLLKGVVSAAEQLPAIIKTAGDVAAMRRGGGAPPEARPDPRQRAMPPGPQYQPLPPRQERQMMPVSHVAPLGGWATEDSPPPVFAPLPPPAMEPRPVPPPPQGMPPPMQAMPPQAPVPTPMYPVTPPGGTPPPMPMQSAPPPASGALHARPERPSMPPPAPVQSAPPPAAEISDQEILQYAPMFEAFFAEPESPEEKARALLPIVPNIREIASGLSEQRIAETLRKNGRPLSPLVRRQGQDYMRRFRQAILKSSQA